MTREIDSKEYVPGSCWAVSWASDVCMLRLCTWPASFRLRCRFLLAGDLLFVWYHSSPKMVSPASFGTEINNHQSGILRKTSESVLHKCKEIIPTSQGFVYLNQLLGGQLGAPVTKRQRRTHQFSHELFHAWNTQEPCTWSHTYVYI